MGIGRRTSAAVVATVVSVALLPAAGAAAAPPNDDASRAVTVGVPSSTDGTTVDATREPGEDASCESSAAGVWYRFTTDRTRRVVLGLAPGATPGSGIDLYRVDAAGPTYVHCGVTDEFGRAGLFVDALAGETYLVRVAPRVNSAAGDFRLVLQLADAPAEPPGEPLLPEGASGILQYWLNPTDAYAVTLKGGVPYRFNMSPGGCNTLELYRRGIGTFEGKTPLIEARCFGSAYFVYTPGKRRGGVYSLVAAATDGNVGRWGTTAYRVMAARAGRDDVPPGRSISNERSAPTRLDATTIDVEDWYHFTIRRRSAVKLALATDEDIRLVLFRDGVGALTYRKTRVERTLPAGTYYVQVRAGDRVAGRYRLRRTSRPVG